MVSVGLKQDVLADEFSLQNFAFTNTHDSLLTSFQWALNKRNIAYLVYRWLVFATILGLTVFNFVRGEKDTPGVSMVYATNWSIILLDLAVLLMAINSSKFVAKKEYLDWSHRTPSLLSQVEWLLYSISYPISLTVTIAFWTFIFAFPEQQSVFLLSRESQVKHCVFTVYVLIDLWLSAVPLRFLHFIYPMSISLVYILFNAIYFRNQGKSPIDRPYAYYMVDWRSPGMAIIACIGGLAILISMYFLLFAIYRLKMLIFWRTIGDRNEERNSLIKSDSTATSTAGEETTKDQSRVYSSTERSDKSLTELDSK